MSCSKRFHGMCRCWDRLSSHFRQIHFTQYEKRPIAREFPVIP